MNVVTAMDTAETSGTPNLDLHREQLLEIARLAHMLAYTSPQQIPLIELRKMLRIEGIDVSERIRGKDAKDAKMQTIRYR